MTSKQDRPDLRFNIEYWEEWIRKDFISHIERFTQTIERKVLIGFKNTEDEANQVRDDTLNDVGKRWNPDSDPASAYEIAQDAGIDYYGSMRAVEQTLLNSCVVSLYQLFEQQRIYILRKEFLEYFQLAESSDFTVHQFKKAMKLCDIDLENFNSWNKISEMKLLCDAIKHAEGRSSKKLRRSRPDFFQHPDFKETSKLSLPWLSNQKLYFTLNGEGIYVSLKDLKSYTTHLVHFWNELIEAARTKHQYEHS